MLLIEFGNKSNIEIRIIIDIENDKEITINLLIFLNFININSPPIRVLNPAIKDNNKGPNISIFILKYYTFKKYL